MRGERVPPERKEVGVDYFVITAPSMTRMAGTGDGGEAVIVRHRWMAWMTRMT